jgi:hypothetical protein
MQTARSTWDLPHCKYVYVCTAAASLTPQLVGSSAMPSGVLGLLLYRPDRDAARWLLYVIQFRCYASRSYSGFRVRRVSMGHGPWAWLMRPLFLHISRQSWFHACMYVGPFVNPSFIMHPSRRPSQSVVWNLYQGLADRFGCDCTDIFRVWIEVAGNHVKVMSYGTISICFIIMPLHCNRRRKLLLSLLYKPLVVKNTNNKLPNWLYWYKKDYSSGTNNSSD